MTPQFDSLAAFLEMGGYGAYVWGSYVIAAITLALNVILPLRRHRAVRTQLKRRLVREAEKSRQAGNPDGSGDTTAR